MRILDKLYGKIIIPLSYFLRGDLRFKYFEDYKNNLKKDKKEIEEYQLEKLKKLITHAYDSVPYYKKLFDENNIKPDEIHSLEDYKRIPTLSKEEIIRNFEELKSNKKYKMIDYTSGGSTGKRVTICKDKRYTELSRAAWLRDMYSVGCDVGEKSAWFWGSDMDNEPIQTKFLNYLQWKINRRILFNTFHYKDDDLKEWLLNDFNKFKPAYIIGYSHSIYQAAKYIKKNNLKIHQVKKIICTAEKMEEREFIEKVFNCKVIDHYGCREVLTIAIEDNNYIMHSSDDFVLVELNEDEEVLLTPLESYGMPLLRYMNGDKGTKKIEKQKKDNYPFNEFNIKIGRISEELFNTKGERVKSPFITHIAAEEKLNVGEYQIVQKSLHHLVLNIVKSDKLDKRDVEKLKEIIWKLLGKSNIEVNYLDTYPLEPSGKKISFKCLIQEEPIKVNQQIDSFSENRKSFSFERFIIQSIYSLKGDQRFKYFEEYKKNLSKTRKEIEDFQIEKLRKLISHAYSTVPYYKELFDNNKIKPEDIKSIDDLKKIPMLTKMSVLSNLDKLKSRKKYKLIKHFSGGSTGNTSIIYKDKRYNELSSGVWMRDLYTSGLNPGDKVAWVWGDTLINYSFIKKLVHNLSNRINKRIMFNVFKYTDKDVEDWIKNKFNKFKPDYIYGYAGAIYDIAKCIEKNNIKFTPIKKIITTSERLENRDYIERIFKCKVIDQYGCSEVNSIAIEDDNYIMHSSDDFVITEVNENNEILLTPLESYGMPLIRYRNGDIGLIKNRKKDDKETYPFKEFNLVVGRIYEVLLNKQKEKISGGMIKQYVEDENLGIREFQVVQKSFDFVELNIVKDEFTKEEHGEKVADFLKQILRCKKVEINILNKFPTERNGKRIAFKCEIKDENPPN